MNKTTQLLFGLLLAFACLHQPATAQDSSSNERLRVAILAPLYIDSAFNGNAYKLGSSSMPKYLLPGLEFYNGAMLAVDSLQKEHQPLDIWVYDTKQAGKAINNILAEMEPKQFSLIIASLSNVVEQKLVSDFSFKYNIPVISATYPNTAGLGGNPFFIMLNSSLRTHVEALHSYIQQNYSNQKIVFITRKGALESKIRSDFAAKDSSYPRIRYTVAELNDHFTGDQLRSLLDSTRQNVIICGSLNEAFGTNLVNNLCAAASYKTVAIGMPTWDGLKALNNENCSQLEVVYSTPYNYSRTDKTGATLVKQYRAKFFSRPSDMVFKGYESLFHFSKLLLKYRNDFINHLSDTTGHIANQFNFEPARLSSSSFVPDYLENKKLYFVKMQGGVVKSIN